VIETSYRVDLEQFSGPLDLLLHLLRQEELEVGEIQVAAVCDRYLSYLHDLERIDIDAAGEFLVMASTLMRLKSRSMLPSDELALEDDDLDPRFELVRQLIEYRKFKRVAGFLEERRALAERLFPRGMQLELEELKNEPREFTDTAGATVDTLFAAFARLLQETRGSRTYVVTKDDTPMEEHMVRLRAQLVPGERVAFRLLFPADATRAYVIGVFLGLLELMKQGEAHVIQDEEFGQILVEGRDQAERERVLAAAEVQRTARLEAERLQAEKLATSENPGE
jgi:segregation and condensation protein A